MGKYREESNLNAICANLQSFSNKKREIELLVAAESYDLLFFTEIWYNVEQHDTSELFLGGFQCPLISPARRGGACAFIREGLNFIPVEPPEKVSESVWFSMQTIDKANRLYGCIYRSPNSTEENNQKLLKNIFWAKENFSELILIGFDLTCHLSTGI